MEWPFGTNSCGGPQRAAAVDLQSVHRTVMRVTGAHREREPRRHLAVARAARRQLGDLAPAAREGIADPEGREHGASHCAARRSKAFRDARAAAA
jgi:hypothetical protein